MYPPSANARSAPERPTYTLPATRLADLWRRHAAAAPAATTPPNPPLPTTRSPHHSDSFFADVVALLRRYRENTPTGLRTAYNQDAHAIKLANHYATPPPVMEALHHAFSATTELFASPLNVHPATRHYCSVYDEDRAFGAYHDAYATSLRTLGHSGAILFNPEYDPPELLKAVQTAITAAQSPDYPFLAVGILPNWPQMPYHRTLCHASHRATNHLLAHSPTGCFNFTTANYTGHNPKAQTGNTCQWPVDFFLISNEAGRARFMRPGAEDILKTALVNHAMAIYGHTSKDNRDRAMAGIGAWPHPSPPPLANEAQPPPSAQPPPAGTPPNWPAPPTPRPDQTRLAAIGSMLHALRIRRYGPGVEPPDRERFYNDHAPASPPSFYADSAPGGPMEAAVTLYFNPLDTAALHLRSVSPHQHHSGFALIHEPRNIIWDGAYYAVLQRDAHKVHIFIRKAIADLAKASPSPTLGLIAVPIDALSTSMALLSHPSVFLAGIHQPDRALTAARTAFIHEPSNCSNPPRSDQTHLVLAISNPPGVDAYAQGHLLNLACLAQAPPRRAGGTTAETTKAHNHSTLRATLDQLISASRNAPHNREPPLDAEPITSAASTRATTTLTALLAEAPDQAHLS